MTINHHINIFAIIGLVLDIIGVLLVYYNGLPSPIDEAQDGLLIGSRLTDEMEASIRKKAKWGLILLIAGFFFQLLSTVFSF